MGDAGDATVEQLIYIPRRMCLLEAINRLCHLMM